MSGSGGDGSPDKNPSLVNSATNSSSGGGGDLGVDEGSDKNQNPTNSPTDFPSNDGGDVLDDSYRSINIGTSDFSSTSINDDYLNLIFTYNSRIRLLWHVLKLPTGQKYRPDKIILASEFAAYYPPQRVVEELFASRFYNAVFTSDMFEPLKKIDGITVQECLYRMIDACPLHTLSTLYRVDAHCERLSTAAILVSMKLNIDYTEMNIYWYRGGKEMYIVLMLCFIKDVQHKNIFLSIRKHVQEEYILTELKQKIIEIQLEESMKRMSVRS